MTKPNETAVQGFQCNVDVGSGFAALVESCQGNCDAVHLSAQMPRPGSDDKLFQRVRYKDGIDSWLQLLVHPAGQLQPFPCYQVKFTKVVTQDTDVDE